MMELGELRDCVPSEASEEDCPAATEGIAPAAWAMAALTSSAVTWISAGGWLGSLGESSCCIFSWNDCAFSAAVAAGSGCDTGAGFFNTNTKATTDVRRVAILMMRSTFMLPIFIAHLRP